jgi:hypothetical protein
MEIDVVHLRGWGSGWLLDVLIPGKRWFYKAVARDVYCFLGLGLYRAAVSTVDVSVTYDDK